MSPNLVFTVFNMHYIGLTILVVVTFLSFGRASGWDDYINNNILRQGITKAAIVGLDGSIWAKSKNFNPTKAELLKLIHRFSDEGPLRASGLFLNGVEYLVADERYIYGKGQGGAVCVKTVQTVIIAIFDEKIQPGQASNAVEKFADYLIEQGY